MAYPGMSYWDAYALPIPVRRYMIQRYNKRVEDEQAALQKQGQPSKTSMEKNIQKFTNNIVGPPQNMSNMMQPIRNK
jgi:TFIIF-interacting CTD phosphatase-like protein